MQNVKRKPAENENVWKAIFTTVYTTYKYTNVPKEHTPGTSVYRRSSFFLFHQNQKGQKKLKFSKIIFYYNKKNAFFTFYGEKGGLIKKLTEKKKKSIFFLQRYKR